MEELSFIKHKSKWSLTSVSPLREGVRNASEPQTRSEERSIGRPGPEASRTTRQKKFSCHFELSDLISVCQNFVILIIINYPRTVIIFGCCNFNLINYKNTNIPSCMFVVT